MSTGSGDADPETAGWKIYSSEVFQLSFRFVPYPVAGSEGLFYQWSGPVCTRRTTS